MHEGARKRDGLDLPFVTFNSNLLRFGEFCQFPVFSFAHGRCLERLYAQVCLQETGKLDDLYNPGRTTSAGAGEALEPLTKRAFAPRGRRGTMWPLRSHGGLDGQAACFG